MPYVDENKKLQYQAEYRARITPEQRHKYYVDFKNRREKSWRKYMYKTLYGITQEDYNLLLEKQEGKCAICRQPPKEDKVLCVDHCHGTGKVRGLLCHSCNTSIGKLGGIDGLEAALDYLKTFYRVLFSSYECPEVAPGGVPMWVNCTIRTEFCQSEERVHIVEGHITL